MNSGSGNACQTLAALLPLTSDAAGAQRCTSIAATICRSIVGLDDEPEAIGSGMQAAECGSLLGSLENAVSRSTSAALSSSPSGPPEFTRFKLERDVRQSPHGWAPYKNRALIIAFSMLVASYFYCLAMISRCSPEAGPSSCCWTLVPTIGSLLFCLCLLIVYRGNSPVCCQCQVLTRMKEQEERDLAQRAQTAKQQFITYVFHNIRVPFNAIVLGLGHIRASGCGDYSLETMDLVQLMLDSAETMTSVLDDVTDLGNWADGPLELNRDEFDFLGVVKFLVWGLKDLLGQKQISLNMDVDRVSTAVLKSHNVVSDKHRVVQTLGNFLSNAVKFSPSGGKLELVIKCEELDSSLVPLEDNFVAARHQSMKLFVAVKGTGAGISFKHQQNIFEPGSFLTSHWVQSLGLKVPKRFIEQIGGNIGIHSRKGSTFYFVAPFALVPVQKRASSVSEISYNGCGVLPRGEQHRPASEAEVAKDATSDSSGKRKVLLVEDTKINRIILRKVLQKLNLQCDEAENGQVAVDLHKKGKSYDLVLMDKEMPVMDGHEATRALRKMGVKTPIIALTGNALQSDKKLFFEAGVNEFQTKPLSRDKLVQLLARHGVGVASSGLRH